jgi:hypothetical protein
MAGEKLPRLPVGNEQQSSREPIAHYGALKSVQRKSRNQDRRRHDDRKQRNAQSPPHFQAPHPRQQPNPNYKNYLDPFRNTHLGLEL